MAGGTSITVLGADVWRQSSEVTCVFGSSRSVAAVVDSHSLVCKTPAGSTAGVVGFSLSLGSSGAAIGEAKSFEYLLPVHVSGLWPLRGTVAGGTMVSVTGSGFREAGLRCRFGGEEVLDGEGAQFVSSSIVACVAPASVSGTGTVAVEVSVNGGSDFTSDRVEYLYEESATVTGLRPSVGVSGASDQVVTVMGEHFARSAELVCRFGLNETVRATYESSSQVTCLAPPRGVGTVSVRVSMNGVDDTVDSARFTYTSSGHIATVTPSAGPVGGRTVVTVTGVTLEDRDAAVRCAFGTQQGSGRGAYRVARCMCCACCSIGRRGIAAAGS